ncbi:MAG: hypothetical protein ACREEM_10265, partial [Blastocatellia bacterium]
MKRNRKNLLQQTLVAILITALLIPSWIFSKRATAFSSNDAELAKAISELQAAAASLPAKHFSSAVRKDLE